MPTGGTPVQSIDRVFAIVETLASEPHGMTLTDLASSVDLHVSTTHRLLSALVARDYVQKDMETGKYRLTMRLFEISSRVVGGMSLVSVARPFLERLADATNETIHLVARNRDEVVYLYKEDNNNSVTCMSSFVGKRNAMYCTGVGKSILAYLPEEEVCGIWERTTITAYTERTIVDYSTLLLELEQIRKNGVALIMRSTRLVSCVLLLQFSITAASPSARLVYLPRQHELPQKRSLISVVLLRKPQITLLACSAALFVCPYKITDYHQVGEVDSPTVLFL